MLAPLDKKTRHLEMVGPVWRPPNPKAVLRSLPVLARVPPPLFRAIARRGAVRECGRGEVFWAATDLSARSRGEMGPGVFVVLAGAVRRLHARPDGAEKVRGQGG